MRIVIAEDDENSRLLLQVALEGKGHTVTAGKAGLEALAAIRAAPPDVIISDILMPRMDGYDLCRILKNDVWLHTIPFIFYSFTDNRFNNQQFGFTFFRFQALKFFMDFFDILDFRLFY